MPIDIKLSHLENLLCIYNNVVETKRKMKIHDKIQILVFFVIFLKEIRYYFNNILFFKNHIVTTYKVFFSNILIIFSWPLRWYQILFVTLPYKNKNHSKNYKTKYNFFRLSLLWIFFQYSIRCWILHGLHLELCEITKKSMYNYQQVSDQSLKVSQKSAVDHSKREFVVSKCRPRKN